MTELSWFAEPDISRTGAAPPPDTLVALLGMPRMRLSPVAPVAPATEPRLLDLALLRPKPAAPPRLRLRMPAVGAAAPVAARVALVAVAGLAGAAPSIGGLLWEARAERPGARLLVALLAGAAVLGLRARRPFREPDIHDRDVDWLLALSLLAVTGFFVTSVADRVGPGFGSRHLGLLAVPLLVAAATTLAFGTRTMWRLRLPLVLLLVTLLPLPGRWESAAVPAASRVLRRVLAGPVAAAGLPVRPVDPTPWLGGLAGVASLLVALILLSAVVGRRLLAVAGTWAVLTVLRTALAAVLPAGVHPAVTGPVADLVVCVAVLAVTVLVVRRAGRPPGAPATSRLAPIARCLDITAVRLRGDGR